MIHTTAGAARDRVSLRRRCYCRKKTSIASLLGSAAALTEPRASGFYVSCLATCLEHDASAAQFEVTKRGNILII